MGNILKAKADVFILLFLGEISLCAQEAQIVQGAGKKEKEGKKEKKEAKKEVEKPKPKKEEKEEAPEGEEVIFITNQNKSSMRYSKL